MAKYVPLSNKQVNDTISSWLGGVKAQESATNATIARNQSAGTAAATSTAASSATHATNRVANPNNGGENLLQRAMDFLSIGDYAVGGALGSINRENARADKAAAAKGLDATAPVNRGTRYAPDDPRANGFGRDIVAGLQGAAHGIAQGFAGAKAVGGTVETPGKVLDETGALDKAGVTGAGKGVLGFAADVALDPLNLVGAGELKAGAVLTKGALKGAKVVGEDGATATVRGVAGARAAKAAYDSQVAAKAAAKAAARAQRSAIKLGTANVVTPAAAVSKVTDEASAAANVASEAAAAGETRVAAKAAEQATEGAESVVKPAEEAVSEVPASVTGAEHVGHTEANAVAEAAPEEVAARTAVGDGAGEVAAAAKAVKQTPEALRAAKAQTAANELLKTLTTKGRAVPARAILDASVTGAKPIAEPQAIAHLITAVHDAGKAHEVTDAIKEAKKFPEARKFLATPVKVQGTIMPLEKAMERAGVRRATGQMDAGGAAAMQVSKSALAAAHRIPKGRFDADQLTAAIHDFDPDLSPDVGHVLQQLHALKPEHHEAFLRDVLGESAGTQFGSFDEAIAAAVNGQVDASGMRQMLKALGIRTNATQEKTLIATMSSKATEAWETILHSIPTPEETLADAGFDADTVAAAAATDVEEVTTAAAAQAEEAAARAGEDLPADPAAEAESAAQAGADGLTVQPSPLGEPAIGSLAKILKEYGQDPLKQEDEGQKAWRKLTVDVLGAIRHKLNNLPADASRADKGYEALTDWLSAGESYLRSKGVMPTFSVKGGQTWYFSFGQVLDQLSPDIVKRTFFDLDHRLSKAGKGFSAAAQEAHKAGLTVFPSQFGEATVAALRGHDEAGILKTLMAGGKKNAFSQTPEGAAALRDLAKEMADPSFRETLNTIHEGQQVIALAFAQRAADDVVGPLATEFIRAVSTYGDRSQIVNLIGQASQLARRAVAEGQDTTLLKQLIEQHSQNGILSGLLEKDGATVRADVRADAATGKSEAERAAEQADVAAKPKPSAQRGKAQRAADHETRGDGAANDEQHAAETPETQADLAEDLHANGWDDTPAARVELLANIRATMTWARRRGDRVGEWLSGEYGMAAIKPRIAQAMSGTHVATQDFHNKILTWGLGAASKGDAARAGADTLAAQGLIKRLQPIVGGPVTIDTVHAYTKTWWQAVAAATLRDPALAGDELKQALMEGAAPITREDGKAGSAAAAGAEGLSEDEASMALELHELIQEVFEPKNGQLQRMQQTSTVLAKELARHGARSGIFPDADADLGASAGLWRNFDYAGEHNPLDDLLTWKSATEAASVGPATADMLTGMARDLGLEEKLTTDAQKVAAGWKRIDTKRDDTFIVQHLKPGALYPPEFLDQLPYAEHMLQQVQKSGQTFANPELNKAWNQTIAASDFITNILKTSQTIWRPAHHIDNLLGDGLINLMRGVNPLYTVQAPKILKALGQIGDVPDEVAGSLSRAIVDSPEELPEVGDVAAHITLQDGTVVPLTHAQVAAEGRRRGVFVTDKIARDALPGSAARGSLGSEVGRKIRNVNPIQGVDKRLGAFSAARDNLTRTPHFLHVLEESSYPSLEAALDRAAQDVAKWHPSIQQLSVKEQKIARRLFYFYTWQRKTASLVVKTALDRPTATTAISKAQFEMANANGLNPESIGQPTPSDDPRVPTYASQGLLGPTFTGGYNPLNPGSETETYGDSAHDWGISLSAPQIDSLQSLFQGNPFEVAISSANPLVAVPLELGFNSQPETSVKPQDNVGRFLLNQTGTPATLLTAATGDNGKTAPKNGTPAQLGQFAASQSGNQARTALNYLTGLKFQDYTSLSNQKNAALEVSANKRKQLKDQGYSDAAIDTLMRMQRAG